MSDHPERHLSDDDLNAYLDGELAPSARAHLDAHLADCLQCRSRFDSIRLLFRTIEGLPEEPLERDLSMEVVAALMPRIKWSARLRALAFAELLAALILLALAWPAASRLPSLLTRLSSGVQTAWELASRTLGAGAASIWDRALAAAGTFGDLPDLGLLHVHAPLVGGAIAGALVLWLAGNGVLLRRQVGPRSEE